MCSNFQAHFTIHDVKIHESHRSGWVGRGICLKNGTVLYYNSNLWQNVTKIRPDGVFLCDQNDLHIIEAFRDWDISKSIRVFRKYKPHKNLYLRTFATFQDPQNPRVFVSELVDMFPELPEPKNKNKEPEFFETISVTELSRWLDEAKIDKSMITLVPDPYWTFMMKQSYAEYMGNISMCLPGPFGYLVCNVASACLVLFNYVTYFKNWELPEFAMLKTAVIGEMERIRRISEQEHFYIPLHKIKKLDEIGRPRGLMSEPSPISRSFRYNDLIQIQKKELIGMFEVEAGEIPAWKANILLNLCWLEQFFGSTEVQIKKLIRLEIMMLSPGSEPWFPLKSILKKKVHFEEPNPEEPEPEEPDSEEPIEKKKKKKKSSKKKGKNPAPPTDTSSGYQDPPPSCQKCFRTHQHCEEAKANLKSSESKVKKLENKLETAEKMNSEFKKKEAKIREQVENEWKERFEAMEKKLKDEKEMKSKMQTITKENKTLKESIEEMKKNQEQLKGDKDELQGILEQKEQEIVELREQGQMAKSETRFMERRIEDLTKTYSRLIEENQKLKKISTKRSDPMDPLKQLFIEMVDTKNRHLQEQQGLQATEKVQKLKKLSEDPRVLRQADLELKRYNLEYQKFMDSLTRNISNLQSLIELPDAPELSKGFMEAYNEAIARELFKELGPDEISDPECLICTDNMTELKGTLKCTKCLRRYHVPCVGKWLTEHIGCPVCKMNMRDLEKYPELAPYRS